MKPFLLLKIEGDFWLICANFYASIFDSPFHLPGWPTLELKSQQLRSSIWSWMCLEAELTTKMEQKITMVITIKVWFFMHILICFQLFRVFKYLVNKFLSINFLVLSIQFQLKAKNFWLKKRKKMTTNVVTHLRFIYAKSEWSFFRLSFNWTLNLNLFLIVICFWFRLLTFWNDRRVLSNQCKDVKTDKI